MTDVEKKIRHINYLNKRVTFELLPAIHTALSGIVRTHEQLMNSYAELIELTKQSKAK